jgi:16S rRNA (adenine1518-N6/adenine1519-N6)-dimethyltransferase
MRRGLNRESGGLYQKKSLGQVFLSTDWPVERMVERLKDWGVERVVEIGPGPGILTRGLIRAGIAVTAVEKDERFADRLAEVVQAEPGRLTVVREDFLRFDLEGWLAAAGGRAAVIGNIPYNISSSILLKVLPLLQRMAGLVVMTQLEFAARVAARPDTKDYGSLSVFTQLRGIVKMEFKVERACFKPVPKVDSAVISIQPLKQLLPEDVLQKAEMLTRAAFSQRRKKLRNSVRQFFHEGGLEARSPIDLDRRAETLTPHEFVELAEFLVK